MSARSASAPWPISRRPGPAQEFHLAHRKRREVVVQHEALEGFVLEEQVEALHVFLGAQRERGQGLGFAAGEERRAVHARQQAHFAGDLANLVERPAVGTALRAAGCRRGRYFSRRRSKARIGQLAAILVLFGNAWRGSLSSPRPRRLVAFLLGMLGGVQGVVQPRAVASARSRWPALRRTAAAAPRPSSA